MSGGRWATPARFATKAKVTEKTRRRVVPPILVTRGRIAGLRSFPNLGLGVADALKSRVCSRYVGYGLADSPPAFTALGVN